MNPLKHPKDRISEAFDSIEIPENLDFVVRRAMQRERARQRVLRMVKYASSVAAVFVISAVTLLNVSPVFAKAVQEVPVLGDLCRIFTFRHYDFQDEVKVINVTVPQIENTGNSELENRINLEISRMIAREIEAATAHAEEYYEAYLATGGDPEEYMTPETVIDYEIKYISQDIVSFQIYKFESIASAYQTNRYYNIDIETGKELTLRDIFGENYQEIVYEEIAAQIPELDEFTKSMLFPDVDIKELLDENRKFYFSEDGTSLVVVFEKYEIAAGAGGQIEFTIPCGQER